MAKRLLVPLLKVLVSVALITFILSRIGITRFKHSITEANLTWILLAIVVFSVSNFLGALQWNMLLCARGITFPFRKTFVSYYIALFLNNFLVGYIGGDTFRAYDVSKLSGKTSTAISTIFLDRIIGFTVLTSLALLASAVWSGLLVSTKLGLVILVLLGMWMLMLLFFFKKSFALRFLWLFDIMLPKSFHSRLKSIYQNIHAYRENVNVLLKVMALSLVIQFLRILVHFVAALAVGINISAIYFFVFIPIIAFVSSLPISIGGIGVREQSGILLFSQIAVSEPQIVAMEFLAYLVGVIATIPGGLIFILRKEHTRIKEVRELDVGTTA